MIVIDTTSPSGDKVNVDVEGGHISLLITSADGKKSVWLDNRPDVEMKRTDGRIGDVELGPIHSRGHVLRLEGSGAADSLVGKHYVYADSGEKLVRGQDRPCARCGRRETVEGHDPCLAALPGVAAACCGHGVAPGYMVFSDSTELRFELASVKKRFLA